MRHLTKDEAAAIAERQVIARPTIRLMALPSGYKVTVGDRIPWPGFWNDAEKKDE